MRPCYLSPRACMHASKLALPTPPYDLAVVSTGGRPHSIHTTYRAWQDTNLTPEDAHPNLQNSMVVVEHRRAPRGPAIRSVPAHWPCDLSPTLPCRPCPLRRPPWPRARTSVTPAEGASRPLRLSPACPTPHPRAATTLGVAPRAMLAGPAAPARRPALPPRTARLAARTPPPAAHR